MKKYYIVPKARNGEEQFMDSTIKLYIGSLIRNALAPFVVWLSASGYVSSDEATAFVVAGVTVVVSVAWGLVNKYIISRSF